MIKFHGLNENESSDSSKDEELIVTIEAKEDQAISQHSEALALIASGDRIEALLKFNEVLDSPFLLEASETSSKDPSFLSAKQLQYSCYKNIATLLEGQGRHSDALDCYIYALDIDKTDVLLWYKMGRLALSLKDYVLARHAFEEGFQTQPTFWPCLDQLISLLYAIFDYVSCLYYIQEAFKKDPEFLKGHIIRDVILKEQPSIKEDIGNIYKNVSLLWEVAPYDSALVEPLLKEALEIRRIRFEDAPIIPLKKVVLQVEGRTFEALGSCLVKGYDLISEGLKEGSLCAQVVLEIQEESARVVDPTADLPSEAPSETEEGELAQEGSDPELDKTKTLKKKRSVTNLETLEGRFRLTRSKHAQIRHEEEQDSLRVELRSFLPTSLLAQAERRPAGEPHSTKSNTCESRVEPSPLSLTEASDVTEFTLSYSDVTLITLMWEFLVKLSKKWDHKWSCDLSRTFCEVHKRVMNHRRHPDFIHNNGFSDCDFIHDIHITLLNCELILALRIPVEHNVNSLIADPLTCDLTYLAQTLTAKQSLFSDRELCTLRMRAYYAQSVHYEGLGWIDQATRAADTVLGIFDDLEKSDLSIQGFFVKDKMATRLVTKSLCEGNLKKLERSVEMAELPDLFSKSQFAKIIDLVKSSFDMAKEARSKGLERANEIVTFIEALYESGLFKDCFRWSEVGLDECLPYYTNLAESLVDCVELADNLEEKKTERDEELKQWANVISGLTDFMEDCFAKIAEDAFSTLDLPSAQRLAENLISIACYQLEMAEADPELPFESMSPLILLHRLIAFEEDKAEDEEKGHYLNAEFLGKIHDLLGKHAWCVSQEGKFLLYAFSVFVSGIDNGLDESICHYIEQCAHCLFKHQSKRPKLKNFQDHNVPGIPLTWESAKMMAEYFFPDKIPEFDSKAAVTADVYDLAKKIVGLFPQELQPGKSLDQLNVFIRGKSEEMPIPSLNLPQSRVIDSHYLLADFYFKNGEFPKARKHYKIDLCYRAERFSSWVGIALALAKDVEDEIDSCQKLDSIDDLLNRSDSAIRCFKSAFKLTDFELLTWIELGSFAYVMHSFCRRYINSSDGVDLSIEEYERIEKNIGVMLVEANEAFDKSRKLIVDMALESEELWYVEYMLGKISEKNNQPPSVWISHYLAAANHLFELGASYPKKISYNSPQKYAVEAVEIHYRIHASMLKYLLVQEGEVLDPEVQKLFLDTILLASESPFVKQLKKVESDNSRKRKVSESDHELSSDVEIIDDSDTQKDEESQAVAKEAYDAILSGALSVISRKIIQLHKPESPDVIMIEDGEVKKGSSDLLSGESSRWSSQGRNDHWPLVQPCLEALLLCASRFSQHFKSLYRVAYYYFNSKFHENIDFSRNTLLSKPLPAHVQLTPEMAKKRTLPSGVGGLFCNWNIANFFNGVWRNPAQEINRSGSFAGQMSRCVALLLEVLKTTKDTRTLLEMSVALKEEPDDDKKYLNETERQEYATAAFTYMVSVFRENIKSASAGRIFSTFQPLSSPQLPASPKALSRNLFLDVCRCYNKVEKDMTEKMGEMKPLVVEAYKAFRGSELPEGQPPTLSEALDFYKQKQAQVRRAKRPILTDKWAKTGQGISPSGAPKVKRSRTDTGPRQSVVQADSSNVTPKAVTSRSEGFVGAHRQFDGASNIPKPISTPRQEGFANSAPKIAVGSTRTADRQQNAKPFAVQKSDSALITSQKPVEVLKSSSCKVEGTATPKTSPLKHESAKNSAPKTVSASKLSEISSVYSSMLARAQFNLDVEVRGKPKEPMPKGESQTSDRIEATENTVTKLAAGDSKTAKLSLEIVKTSEPSAIPSKLATEPEKRANPEKPRSDTSILLVKQSIDSGKLEKPRRDPDKPLAKQSADLGKLANQENLKGDFGISLAKHSSDSIKLANPERVRGDLSISLAVQPSEPRRLADVNDPLGDLNVPLTKKSAEPGKLTNPEKLRGDRSISLVKQAAEHKKIANTESPRSSPSSSFTNPSTNHVKLANLDSTRGDRSISLVKQPAEPKKVANTENPRSSPSSSFTKPSTDHVKLANLESTRSDLSISLAKTDRSVGRDSDIEVLDLTTSSKKPRDPNKEAKESTSTSVTVTREKSNNSAHISAGRNVSVTLSRLDGVPSKKDSTSAKDSIKATESSAMSITLVPRADDQFPKSRDAQNHKTAAKSLNFDPSRKAVSKAKPVSRDGSQSSSGVASSESTPTRKECSTSSSPKPASSLTKPLLTTEAASSLDKHPLTTKESAHVSSVVEVVGIGSTAATSSGKTSPATSKVSKSSSVYPSLSPSANKTTHQLHSKATTSNVRASISVIPDAKIPKNVQDDSMSPLHGIKIPKGITISSDTRKKTVSDSQGSSRPPVSTVLSEGSKDRVQVSQAPVQGRPQVSSSLAHSWGPVQLGPRDPVGGRHPEASITSPDLSKKTLKSRISEDRPQASGSQEKPPKRSQASQAQNHGSLVLSTSSGKQVSPHLRPSTSRPPETASRPKMPTPTGFKTGIAAITSVQRTGSAEKAAAPAPGKMARSFSAGRIPGSSPAKRKASIEEVLARTAEVKRRRDEMDRGLLAIAASSALNASLDVVPPSRPSAGSHSLSSGSKRPESGDRKRFDSKDHLGLGRLANISVTTVQVPDKKGNDSDVIVLD